MISAILLAAGESRRMGQFKQLLRLGDKSFVEHCVDNLLASRLGEIIVVTGHRHLDVRRALGDRKVKYAHNENYHSGMTSSIKRGVESLSDKTQAFVLSLVDQPEIGPNVVDQIIAEFEKSRAPIVIPTYSGRNGHPILLDIKFKLDIQNLGPQEDLRRIVRGHRDQTARVEVPEPAVLEDFDLPEDYERVLRRL